MVRHIVIIGCGTAGAAAALTARKTDRTADITILHSEPVPEYSRCGLPYTLTSVIPKRENLVIHPVSFYRGPLVRADLRLETSATHVDLKGQKVLAEGPKGDTEELTYDTLIFATGSLPRAPPIKGLDLPHVYRLHTLEDARRLHEAAKKAKNAAVIGAGLVGLETTEALHSMGFKVTVIEFLESVLPAMIDPDMASQLQERMEEEGVEVRLGYAAQEILPGRVRMKHRSSGSEEELPADLVVVATGVRPNTNLAAQTGLKLGPTGGIVVDDRMATSAPNVYAAGDCAEYRDLVTGQPVVSGLGSVALRQGEVAGTNAAGGQARLNGVVRASTTRLFGLEIAAAGPTRHTAEQAKLPLLAAKFQGRATAEYYPTEHTVTVKLLAHKETGKLLAGQVIGYCAAQRANLISAAITAGMTIHQLAALETCYAPPVAPIREPITLAAQILSLRHQRLKKKRSKDS